MTTLCIALTISHNVQGFQAVLAHILPDRLHYLLPAFRSSQDCLRYASKSQAQWACTLPQEPEPCLESMQALLVQTERSMFERKCVVCRILNLEQTRPSSNKRPLTQHDSHANGLSGTVYDGINNVIQPCGRPSCQFLLLWLSSLLGQYCYFCYQSCRAAIHGDSFS